MTATLGAGGPAGLERSCEVRSACDRIAIGRAITGIERLAADFHGAPFAPHRHDTYAIGITVRGVQRFRYRGDIRTCLPGQCHILHPDEMHDGAAGTDEGFGYSVAYLDPALLKEALGTLPLPFVAEPVIEGAVLPADVCAAILHIDEEVDEFGAAAVVAAIADLLCRASGDVRLRPQRLDLPALRRVREQIAADPGHDYPLSSLERVSGLDRWSLARQFRAAFGVGPTRFRILRQLDIVRRELRGGARQADAACAAGFADQSHMARHFKRAYGITPGHWAALVREPVSACRAPANPVSPFHAALAPAG